MHRCSASLIKLQNDWRKVRNGPYISTSTVLTRAPAACAQQTVAMINKKKTAKHGKKNENIYLLPCNESKWQDWACPFSSLIHLHGIWPKEVHYLIISSNLTIHYPHVVHLGHSWHVQKVRSNTKGFWHWRAVSATLPGKQHCRLHCRRT